MGFMKQFSQSEALRRTMVDSQLRPSGVNAPWVLAAMRDTPREAFVPTQADAAYMDRSISLGHGRWLNPPVAAGQMLTVADVQATDRVLLIGGGTGYLAALVARRVSALTVVEEAGELAALLSANLPDIHLVQGPMVDGAGDNAPYGLILIDGAVGHLPDTLVAQLAEGGRIVTGLSEGPVTRLASGVKRAGQVTLRPVSDMEIAPLSAFALKKEFVF
jgi:protein-L-isoaspartate(D-aspartate) O-methyltransferase